MNEVSKKQKRKTLKVYVKRAEGGRERGESAGREWNRDFGAAILGLVFSGLLRPRSATACGH